MRDHNKQLNALLLRKISIYITDLLHIFGAISGPKGGIGFSMRSGNGVSNDTESTILPYVEALAEFRKTVRDHGRTLKALELLNLCDNLRDDILPQLGVRLEDKDGGNFAVKLVNREILLKERDAKKAAEAERLAEREKKRLATAQALAAKEAQKKINPKEMFLNELDKYSAFDENVSYMEVIS